MKHETARRLLDARNAALEVLQFTDGKSIHDMRTDRGLQLILQKLLENIGEALNQASRSESDLVTLVPDFRRFLDVRNRITHGYDSVDYGIVWQVATERVPTLIVVLDTALTSAPPLNGSDSTDQDGNP